MATKRGATSTIKKEVIRAPLPWADIRSWSGRLLLGMIILAGVIAGSAYLRQHEVLPVEYVDVLGDFVYVNKPEMEAVTKPFTRGGLLSVDMNAISEAGETLPWVAKVEAKRQWPDTVILNVYEQKVLARWGDSKIINMAGELFTPQQKDLPTSLVRLDGPEAVRDTLSGQVMSLTDSFAEVGLRVQRLEMNKRQASEITFNNGIKLLIGQGDNAVRIMRFKKMYHKILQQHAGKIKAVDMRYANGMAVAWKNGQKPNLHGAV